MNRRRLATALIVVNLGLWLPRSALAGDNLVSNGDLSEGTGQLPNGWRTASQRVVIASDTFSWSHQPGSGGELHVVNHKPNIALWSQTVTLPLGWYYLTGETKTIGNSGDVGTIGVHLMRHEFGLSRLDTSSRGDGWTRGEMYIKVPGNRHSMQIICQLEGRGSASFRHIRLVAISGDPPAGAAQVDLGNIHDKSVESFRAAEPSAFAPARGRLWSVAALVLSLMAITLWGWLALEEPDKS